ncbi:MAG: tetratricopeptide repeat protein [Gammaproteobacteria bacterium]|nr:tetratricopeptide repeat protein [Gammaproteobacteria bacterium]
MKKLFAESFIPVLIVLTLLFISLVYANVVTSIEQEQVVTIEISDVQVEQGVANSDEIDIADDIEFSLEKTSDPLYAAAKTLIAKKLWVEAEGVYRQLLANDRTSHLLNDMGLLFYKQKKYDLAMKNFNESIDTRPVYANAYLYRGLLYVKLGEPDKALRDYEQLVKLVPFHFKATYQIGLIYVEKGQYALAEEYLTKSSKLTGGKGKASALYELGSLYRKQGKQNWPKARKNFEASIRIQPNLLKARFGLASLEDNTLEGKKAALSQLEKAAELSPNSALAQVKLAIKYAESNNTRAAKKAYITAIQINPEYTTARNNLGLLYLGEKSWAKAREEFNAILRANPNDEKSYFNLGRSAFGEKDNKNSLKYYQKAIDLKKGNYPKAYLNQGVVYKKQKDYKSAIEKFKRAIELDHKYTAAWFQLGKTQLQKKDYKNAKISFLKVLDFDKLNASSWYYLGRISSKEKDYDKAIEAYSRAVELKPSFLKAKLNLAVRYSNKKKHEKAAELYQSIVKADATYAKAWLNLGISSFNLGGLDQAETALATYLTLKPDSVIGYQRLARVYSKQQRHKKAVLALEQALDIDISNIDLRLEYASALKDAGRINDAKMELKKALKLDPGNKMVKNLYDSF